MSDLMHERPDRPSAVPASHLSADDPLGAVLLDAIAGRFPTPDGGVTVVGPDETTGLEAVVAFTAHAVVATALSLDEVVRLGADGFAGGHAPDTLRGLAGPGGWIGVLDATLFAVGVGSDGAPALLAATADHDGSHRVEYARETRVDVCVLGDERGFVTLGRGLAGRIELGFEIHDEARRGHGVGRDLLRDALTAVPEGVPVFAACSPGNARSLRCLLAAGFRLIGAEVLIRPERDTGAGASVT
jgi:hypothetical protein